MTHSRSSSSGWEPASRERRFSSQRSAAPSLTDLVDQFSRLNSMVMDSMNQIVMDALEPALTREPRSRSRPHKHSHNCGCEDCGPECRDPCQRDDCHCRCCIGDADLAVYARVGEQRIVPIRIENVRRRERDVTLELSPFASSGGNKTAIKASLLPNTQFTLAPCSEQEVILGINAQISQQDTVSGAAGDAADTRQRLPDVDGCEVFYADLRVEGCAIRPVRIALVLLPRDCDPYVIECGCSCC